MSPKNPLQQQLEDQRFEHAVDYVRQSAKSIKKLHTPELAHLNQILTGKSEDPWRLTPTKVKIPTGKIHEMNILSNPVSRAREILGDSFEMAGNQRIFEAASFLYSHLVLEHLFEDANRRTAVLATIWLLAFHDIEIDPHELLKIRIGDLREKQDRESLEKKISSLKE